ncbi:MAG: LytTR family DNA-binding domain-containing protein [Ruminococcus sp.]|nr:LytTR family DNA-binding domain-containing protein [Ruminococcus sp.]
MKIAVCDDEKAVRDDIAEKIHLLFSDTDIFLYESGDELLAAEAAFDIIFLDIQMEGVNGMETAKKLRQAGSGAVLIFITALKDYVFQAFDVDAFHYLVKPFDKAKFYEVLHQAVQRREAEKRREPVKEEKSISIKSGRVTSKIYLKDIVYAEVFNRKICLHLTNGELEFYGKLSDLEKKLGDGFFRPHRAYLVQLRYVLRYDASSITLENGQTIIMAKQKYEEFVRKYFEYARKDGR